MATLKKSITIGNSLPKKASLTIMLCCSILFASAQDDSQENNSQYVFPSFENCQVRMKSGMINNEIVNYNTITEKMVFMKNGAPFDMTSTTFVDTVTILGRHFVPENGVFYEVLVNAPISLFVQHKSDLLDPGKPAGYGTRSQTSSIDRVSIVRTGTDFYNLKIPDEYIIKPSPVFWIRKDHQMFSFLNKRQLLKIFPDLKDELGKFIDQNRLKTDNTEDMIKLVGFCNEIMP